MNAFIHSFIQLPNLMAQAGRGQQVPPGRELRGRGTSKRALQGETGAGQSAKARAGLVGGPDGRSCLSPELERGYHDQDTRIHTTWNCLNSNALKPAKNGILFEFHAFFYATYCFNARHRLNSTFFLTQCIDAMYCLNAPLTSIPPVK